ncbi:MAG: crossover junction endodeoxyribonuclease RuvC [Anaerolineae bacterium]|nr:crossover junction endodeoxyribonuclease RuvC [Anaerolineae bacterium]MDQ7035186.1 crossover junction endodeoxyribonuclease RuvC [Anaerolineae bacterium]
MLTLGIDPGTAIVGYGLVREHNDGTLQAVEYGVIRTPAKTPMPERLNTIYTSLTEIVEQHQPDRAAVEELFFSRNVTTAITVSQARGVILLALERSSTHISEYKPNFIKQSITGYGGADKKQMQEMVRILLNLEKIPRPDDAADALAIAITDINMSNSTGYDLV